jgi:sulfate adenylyltransferase subunit 2
MKNKQLRELENKSLFIIREAAAQFKNTAILWSMGKDSTTLLWLCRKAFLGRIPFPVIHIDTGFKFPQMYKFRDKIVKEWIINLIVAKNIQAIKQGVNPEKSGRFQCCTKLKTEALKECLKKYAFDAIFLAIRRDEHGIRAKERYFSPRDKEFHWDYKNQPPELWDLFKVIFKEKIHYRIHPLLHWGELDIWEYIKQEKIPVNPLYFSRKGKRYRSLGCMPCTVPIDSNALNIDEIIKELKEASTSERAGRAQDKEKAYMMQKLRSLGYM